MAPGWYVAGAVLDGGCGVVGIEVDPAEIAGRGRAMVAASAAADQVQVARRLSLIEAAMPASLSALAVARLEREWAHATGAWADAARKHGMALIAGGGDYEAVEQEVQRALGPDLPDPPSPGPLAQRGVLP